LKRILVIGDVIADLYRECKFKKACPDAPGVDAIVETGRELRPGGAANVALNLAALAPDVRVDLIGALDVELARTIKFMSGSRVDCSLCPLAGALVKERLIRDGRFVLRVDSSAVTPECVAISIRWSLHEYLERQVPDMILLSDYGFGSVDPQALGMLLRYRDIMLVDTKTVDLSVFAEGGARTLLAKLNHSEWKAVLGAHHSPEDFFTFLVVTDGPGGASLFFSRPGERPGTTVRQSMRLRAHAVADVDVCGCGDTFLAGLAAAMVDGKDAHFAVEFANAAAATVVSKPRTAVADRNETLGLLGRGVG